jgi:hypothetical protein
VNLASTVMLANSAAEEMFGYESCRMNGRPLDALLRADSASRHASSSAAFLKGSGSRQSRATCGVQGGTQ